LIHFEKAKYIVVNLENKIASRLCNCGLCVGFRYLLFAKKRRKELML